MEIIKDISEYRDPHFTAVSLGMFDGVHKGHSAVISFLKQKSEEKKLKSVIFSFWPHPRTILNPEIKIQQLNTLEEKIQLLEERKIDLLFLQNFDDKFSKLEAEDFVRDILFDQLKMRYMIIGHDHRFGKNQKGDFQLLKRMGSELGFEVEQHKAENIGEINISSTKIRNALNDGDILKANEMLAYPYMLSGKVIHGKKIGRTMGYPTANIEVDKSKLLPKKGAYIVEVWIDNQFYKGMLSIGTNPTVDGKELTVEVYILDFSGDIYGKKINIKFRDFLHKEIKFENLEKLIERLDENKYLTEKFQF